MKYIIGVCFIAAIFIGCKKSDEKFDINQIKKESELLKGGYAHVTLNIENQTFYESNSTFKTVSFEINDDIVKISLLDSNQSNVIIDIQNANIKENKEKEFIKLGSDDYTKPESVQFMVGKLVKVGSTFKADGFMFENGKIKIEYFSENLVIVSINGFVIKPGQAYIKENFLPINGYLAIKPASKIP